MKRGFTLIELLVVVLIIGILAAVALPQYQVAVVKSRAAAMLPLLRGISQGNHAYYLANGTRTIDVNNLDVSLPSSCVETTSAGSAEGNGQIWKCGTDWIVDNSGGESVIAKYCPGNNQTNDTCGSAGHFGVYVQWKPTTGYKSSCYVMNDSVLGTKICKSLQIN